MSLFLFEGQRVKIHLFTKKTLVQILGISEIYLFIFNQNIMFFFQLERVYAL